MIRTKASAPSVRPVASRTIIDAMDDPRLFGGRFSGPSWLAWVVLKAMFALPVTDGELALFRTVTGWEQPPADVISEGWIIAGRRAGKTIVIAFVAVYLAFFVDWRKSLAPGERSVGRLLAADRGQARVLKDYIEG